MLFQSLYPIAYYVASTIAASSASCSFDDTTMTDAASISALASCPTLDGTLEISGDAIGSLNLGSIQDIKGTVHIFNSSSATDISFNSLQSISGSLSIDALTQLHVIDFSQLGHINDLSLISLPSLSSLNLNIGVSNLTNLEVSDTALSTLQGLITNVDTVGQLNINNNKNITTLDLGNLESVTENLILSFNGDNCQVQLDNLQWASNLTIQDVGSLQISGINYVNGSLIIAYNKFDSFSMPIEEVGGALQIFANDDMTSFDLSNLTTIGGELRIFNNTELEDMGHSFSSLETVKGAVNIQGSFANLTIPDLSEVDGDFTVQSNNDEFDCKAFEELHSRKKIEGHNFKCVAPTASGSGSAAMSTQTFGSDSDSSDDSDSSSSTASSKSSSSKSDASVVGGGVVMLLLASFMSLLI